MLSHPVNEIKTGFSLPVQLAPEKLGQGEGRAHQSRCHPARAAAGRQRDGAPGLRHQPGCQRHALTGLLPPEAADGDLRGAAEWIEENALSLVKVNGVWFRLGEYTVGLGNGVRQVSAALIPPALRT